MSVLYVTEQGATVRCIEGRIIVKKEKKTLQEVPAHKLEQIVAVGNVVFTASAAHFCMENGVDVAFLSTTGKYRGRLQPEFAKSALLRQRQYERAVDKEYCRRLSATIVAGKLRNMLAMIRQQRRLRDVNVTQTHELETILRKVEKGPDVDTLRGFEGAATAAYFKTFRQALKGDWDFPAREYHPPTTEVNAMLSLGYSLLYNNLFGAVNVVGLDPYMGYFHRPRHGHAALVSDLQEELRAAVVDRLVLTVLNNRQITKHDFLTDEQGRIKLQPAALKKFFAAYASALNEPVYYPQQKIRTTYRQLIELQVRQFARVLLGESETYRPFDAEAAFTQAKPAAPGSLSAAEPQASGVPGRYTPPAEADE